MDDINSILSSIPLTTLAKQMGVSQAKTKVAATEAITTLLGGLQSNVSTPAGEASLASALEDHASAGATVAKGKKIKVSAIDVNDGNKIVTHALGTDTDTVASALSNTTGTDQALLAKLLPILAPVVMAYLASKVLGDNADQPKQTTQANDNGIGDLLGGLLGGMLGGGTQTQSSGSVLGDLLGGMLGGSAPTKPKSSSGNILGDLLGSLF